MLFSNNTENTTQSEVPLKVVIGKEEQHALFMLFMTCTSA